MIDLGSIDVTAAANDGAEVELRHPVTRDSLGVFWTVLGADSDDAQKLIRAEVRRLQLEQQRNRNKQTFMTLDEAEEKQVDRIVALSKSWRTVTKDKDGKVITAESGPYVVLDGDKLEFNAGNVRRVLEARRWIATQLDQEIDERANFMKG